MCINAHVTSHIVFSGQIPGSGVDPCSSCTCPAQRWSQLTTVSGPLGGCPWMNLHLEAWEGATWRRRATPTGSPQGSSHSSRRLGRWMLHTPPSIPPLRDTVRTPAWMDNCTGCWGHGPRPDSVPASGSLHSSWRDNIGDQGDREARTSWRPRGSHQKGEVFSVI